MDELRERLKQLIKEHSCLMAEECNEDCERCLADHLIDNGVTLQEGKPLEAFLHPIDAYKGLKAKYLVFKADTGKLVNNCFVLRPDKDKAAVEALRTYAEATDNKVLSKDIYNWVGKREPMQKCAIPLEEWHEDCGECLADYLIANGVIVADGKDTDVPTGWIPASQPPEEYRDEYGELIPFLVCESETVYPFRAMYDGKVWGDGLCVIPVTHWMHLPEPPKGK